MDYEEIAVRMKSFNEERGEETEDEIWVLEHNSVYTYGVSTDLKNIPAQLPSSFELRSWGANNVSRSWPIGCLYFDGFS